MLENQESIDHLSQNIQSLIDEMSLKRDSEKLLLIENFLLSEKSSGISCIQYAELVKGAEFELDYYKNQLIQNFLLSEKSSGIAVIEFAELIKGVEFASDSEADIFKYILVKDFLLSEKSSGITAIQFAKLIKSAEFKNDYYKNYIIECFLSEEISSGITAIQFAELINNVEFTRDSDGGNFKYWLAGKFLSSERSSNLTVKDFANMINEVGLQNQVTKTIELYKNKFSSSENYFENFIDITKTLHPSEAIQGNFFKEFIKKNRVNSGNLEYLKPFIKEFKDDENVFLIFNTLKNRGVLNDKKDILDLLGGRVRKQYSFLTEIVGDKTLNDCITGAGIETLKTTFGEDLKIGEKPITISDLFTYYDFSNQTSELSAMLKPEFKKQLRDNFLPSAEKLLYKPQELDKLNQLLGERGVSFDVKNYFVENAKLCDYLKEKVGNVEEIDSNKTYQINFTNFGIEEEKKAEINTLFNELLKSNDPDKEKVAKFFSDLLGIAFSDSDDDKLKTFFQQNKKELAHCFCDKELSKEDFESLFTTISDGCFANIGAQFKKMLYGAMIKDEEAQILYAVADDKIFSGIINNHGSDIMVGNFSPINDATIKSYSLSPMVLIKKLSEEKMLTPVKSWEIIGKIAGDDKKNEILEKLSESYSNTSIFDQKAKEIASFLIVKEIVGEEKIKDLTSKNPQLRKLGDFVYDRTPEPSPRNLQQQDQDAPKVNCLFSCFRRQL